MGVRVGVCIELGAKCTFGVPSFLASFVAGTCCAAVVSLCLHLMRQLHPSTACFFMNPAFFWSQVSAPLHRADPAMFLHTSAEPYCYLVCSKAHVSTIMPPCFEDSTRFLVPAVRGSMHYACCVLRLICDDVWYSQGFRFLQSMQYGRQGLFACLYSVLVRHAP